MPELGILGSGKAASNDPVGNFRWLDQSNKRISWGVGADDRWHFADNEMSVRQALVEDGISPETRMRVPGGDIVQRMNVISIGLDSAALIEYENETPVPVAVVIILENYGHLEIDGPIAYMMSNQIIHASKPVASCCSSEDMQGLLRSIEEGEPQPPRKGATLDATRSAALLFPLPHATKLRLLISSEGISGLPNPKECPSFTEIANGWERHFDAGMQFTIPSTRILNAIKASKRHLLIGSGQPIESEFWNKETPTEVVPLSAAALFHWGHLEAGKNLLLKYMERSNPGLFRKKVPRDTLVTLCAWESYFRFAPIDGMAEILLRWMEETLQFLLSNLSWKRKLGRKDNCLEVAALQSSIKILERSGEKILAEEIRSQLKQIKNSTYLTSTTEPLDAALLGDENSYQRFLTAFNNRHDQEKVSPTVNDSVAKSDLTGSFPNGDRYQDPMSSALFLLSVRKSLVQELHPSHGESSILLHEGFDSNWIGSPIEVERAPIDGGEIGLAIRWHGVAPALLWQATTETEFVLRAPMLDTGWSTNQLKGETLLAKQMLPETAVSIVDPQETSRRSSHDNGGKGGSFR